MYSILRVICPLLVRLNQSILQEDSLIIKYYFFVINALQFCWINKEKNICVDYLP
jgi:hypothetical protein